MRYLLVCDYSFAWTAGAQIALLRSAEALQKAGHEVLIFAADISHAKVAPGVQFIESPHRRFRVPPAKFPIYRNTKKLRALIKQIGDEFQPDAVICHSEYGLAFASADVFQPQGIPVMFVVHSFFFTAGRYVPWPSKIAQWVANRNLGTGYDWIKLAKWPGDNYMQNITRMFAKKADIVISPSRHQADSLEATGVKNVQVISNVTDAPGEFTPLPAQPPIRFGWVARFQPEKRLPVALEAIKLAKQRLRAEGLDEGVIELHVVGGDALDGDWPVVWHGKMLPDDVGAFMRSCHAIVMTSYNFDNQPMVILEALSNARPLILSDPKLTREFEGADVPTTNENADGLADAFVAVAKNPQLLERARERAIELSKLSTWQEHAHRFDELVSRSN